MSGLQGGWDFAFAPDAQTIFFTERCRGLSVRSANGSVVRLFGTAGSSLVAAGGDARIFTYGHRNVHAISFRPGTGQPFASEHGPNHSDEVTPLVAGGNGGWDPQNRPGLNCPDNYCGYAGDPTTMPTTDTKRFPNAMRPGWDNDAMSQGTGPCTFLDGTQCKAWNGLLAVGIMSARRLLILQLDASGMAIATTDASGIPSDRYRSLVLGPDGNLYALAETAGDIWRLAPG